MRSIDQALADQVKYMLENSPLPKWMLPVIEQIAYDRGHAYGQDEVNNYILGWLNEFELAFEKNKEDERYINGLTY